MVEDPWMPLLKRPRHAHWSANQGPGSTQAHHNSRRLAPGYASTLLAAPPGVAGQVHQPLPPPPPGVLLPCAPLVKSGTAAEAHAPSSTRPVGHLPVHPQTEPGCASTLPAKPLGVAGQAQQPLPPRPPPGVVRQPLPPQSQLVRQLGIDGQRNGAGWSANTDHVAAATAEMLLASAPKGADGNPVGRIFVGGLPQVSQECLSSDEIA